MSIGPNFKSCLPTPDAGPSYCLAHLSNMVAACRGIAARRYSPDSVADVVGYKQGSSLIQRNANWPPDRTAVRCKKTSQEILRKPRWLAVRKRHEYHLVPGARLAVPRAVLADESAIPVMRRKQIAVVEHQTERRGVVAEHIVGNNGCRDERWALRRSSRVHVLPPIAVGESIKPSVYHRRHVIWNEVIAEVIALIDDCPQCAALRLPRKAVRIAQSRCIGAQVTALQVEFEDTLAKLLSILHWICNKQALPPSTILAWRYCALLASAGKVPHFYVAFRCREPAAGANTMLVPFNILCRSRIVYTRKN